MISWQPMWRPDGTGWNIGSYPGGTWRLAATASQPDITFADQLASEINTIG